MWKESFSISFQPLKLLLGFWAWYTDIMSSGIWACQCFYGEKTNELVRVSLHPYVPNNTVPVSTSPVRIFFSLGVVISRLPPNSLNCWWLLPTLSLHLSYLFPLSLLLSCYWTKCSYWHLTAIIRKMKCQIAITGPQSKASVTALWALMKMRPTDKQVTNIFNLSCSHSFKTFKWLVFFWLTILLSTINKEKGSPFLLLSSDYIPNTNRKSEIVQKLGNQLKITMWWLNRLLTHISNIQGLLEAIGVPLH